MKTKVFRIIGIILLVAGLFSISYGLYYKWETAKVQKSLINDFETVLKKVDDGTTEAPTNSDSKPTSSEEIAEVPDIKPIALIEIPKIGLRVAVADGTTADIIKYAVGHFKGTAMPGEVGNCALIGHRNFTTGEFFLKIDKLNPGDLIKITTYNNSYTYKVTGQEVVAPTGTQVLEPTNEATITLVTCTKGGKNRLVVKGDLVK